MITEALSATICSIELYGSLQNMLFCFDSDPDTILSIVLHLVRYPFCNKYFQVNRASADQL